MRGPGTCPGHARPAAAFPAFDPRRPGVSQACDSSAAEAPVRATRPVVETRRHRDAPTGTLELASRPCGDQSTRPTTCRLQVREAMSSRASSRLYWCEVNGMSKYMVLLYAAEAGLPKPGTPEFDKQN